MKNWYKNIIPLIVLCCGACSDSPSDIQNHPLPKVQKINLVKDSSENISPPKKDSISFSLDYIMGKFDPAQQPAFQEMELEHTSAAKMYLRKDAYMAFQKMYDAAKEDGIALKIRSATRPFHHQKRIWEAKWKGARKVNGKDLSTAIPKPLPRALKILEYSSMPGTSRHHWGTDIDLNAFENSYFEKGQGLKEYNWLVKNAARFGFGQPYTPKGEYRPHGYNEEKWHWSYLPISKILTQEAEKLLQDQHISGFEGAETAQDIQVVQKYVLGISEDCK